MHNLINKSLLYLIVWEATCYSVILAAVSITARLIGFTPSIFHRMMELLFSLRNFGLLLTVGLVCMIAYIGVMSQVSNHGAQGASLPAIRPLLPTSLIPAIVGSFFVLLDIFVFGYWLWSSSLMGSLLIAFVSIIPVFTACALASLAANRINHDF